MARIGGQPRLLTAYKAKASGNEPALALITSTSPVAWRHVHLNGRYAFRDGGQAIDLDAIIRGLNLALPDPASPLEIH